MASSNKTIFLVGAGIAAVLYAAARSSNITTSVKYLQYDIRDIRLNIKSILNPEVVFTVSVFNPNRAAVPVQSFFGQVKNGANVIANFNSASPVLIGGSETATIDVAARLSTANIVMQILQRASFRTLEVAGIIKTGLFDMPFQKVVSLQVPALSGVMTIQRVAKSQTGKQRFFFWRKTKFQPANKYLFQGKIKKPLTALGTVN